MVADSQSDRGAKQEDAADAFQRTIKMLSQYQPLRAQAATSAPKMQLPSGETVWDLSGDWDAVIENYGPKVGDGTYPNVDRITQTGSAFQAIKSGTIHHRGLRRLGVQVCRVS